MDEWMNGWIDGWMNEWMDGWMDDGWIPLYFGITCYTNNYLVQ
jgi:hypothetical protein